MKFIIPLCCIILAFFQLPVNGVDHHADLFETINGYFPAKAVESDVLLSSRSNEIAFQSLTQGAVNAESDRLHQNSVVILNAYSKVKSLNESSENLNYVTQNYRIPEPYCPKRDYNWWGCDPKSKYRSFDGKCNNLKVPWWGKKETPLKRLLPNEYDDGINAPRTYSVKKGEYLPNPRDVSMRIHSARRTFPQTTQFLTFFGQFVDHDITLTARTGYNGQEKNCYCGAKYDKDCFNIPIPYNDYHNKDQKCIPLTRSSAAVEYFGCKFSNREQVDLVTAWTDLSSVYGLSKEQSKKLRSYKKGYLKTSTNPQTHTQSLPLRSERTCDLMKIKESCYFSGDVRVEDNHYLTTFQQIFVLEHNRIAAKLASLNPSWDDEYLYQEARKINIGQYNHIIYWEFLPVLLGSYAMKKWDLIPLKYGYFNYYDDKINPSTSNEFATAAMRWGHVLVNKYHYGYNQQYDNVGNWTTDQTVFNHEHGYYNAYNNIVRGLLVQTSYYFTPAVNDWMNNYLFQGMSEHWARLSLPALNIQRGRDHGLPGYNKYRKYCGLKYAYSFNDLDNIPKEVRGKLAGLYKDVNDIDLFTGAMSEIAVEDGVVGPTVACILAQGFRDWKYGDRYYYETGNPITGFKPNQLQEIRWASLARLICDNTDLYFVQRDPLFEANKKTNPLVDCNKLPYVDLTKWQVGGYEGKNYEEKKYDSYEKY